MPEPRTAVALFSGGLDSSLAVALIREQGVRVVAFHLVSAFCRCTLSGGVDPEIAAAAAELGVTLHTEDATENMLAMVREPRHGFGKHLNPCIDCRINTILRADAFRRSIGADFLISGEVLGQRPMSQNRGAMELIERRTALRDVLLRPLSAQLLEPTLPEREGWVARERLGALKGRGRTEQLAMAARFGLAKYGSPAGGCLLTDAGYCRKLADLLEGGALCDANDLMLLRVGRHFRAGAGARLVTGRDFDENCALETLARPGDRLYQAIQSPGSVVLVRPGGNPRDAICAAGLAVYYSKNRDRGSADVQVRTVGEEREEVLRSVFACPPETLQNIAVGRA